MEKIKTNIKHLFQLKLNMMSLSIDKDKPKFLVFKDTEGSVLMYFNRKSSFLVVNHLCIWLPLSKILEAESEEYIDMYGNDVVKQKNYLILSEHIKESIYDSLKLKINFASSSEKTVFKNNDAFNINWAIPKELI
jgi:hypothetical protein